VAASSSRVAVGDSAGRVLLFTSAGAEHRDLGKCFQDAVMCLSFAPGGRRLVASARDGKLLVWR
jgi:hypothetical protein